MKKFSVPTPDTPGDCMGKRFSTQRGSPSVFPDQVPSRTNQVTRSSAVYRYIGPIDYRLKTSVEKEKIAQRDTPMFGKRPIIHAVTSALVALCYLVLAGASAVHEVSH